MAAMTAFAMKIPAAGGAGGFNSNPAAIPGVSTLQTVVGYAAWTATGMCVLGMIGLGVWLVYNHESGHQGRSANRVGYAIAACVVIGSASSIAADSLGFNLFTSTPQAVPGLSGLQTIISGAAWAGAGVCVIGVILAGLQLWRAYNSGGHVERLIVTLIGCAVVGSAAALTGAFI